LFFAILVFIAAFLIESIGTYTSVVGLSALFAANPVIITLAVSLDFAKVITVSFLYKEWKAVNKTMRAYMLLASAILMIITSAGAAGFLSAEFQKAIIPTKAGDIQVQAITAEKAKLELRKKEIDAQIANLPANVVRGRQKLMDGFKTELGHLNARTIELDAELPKIKIAQVDKVAHAGPILYIAEAFDSTPEKAVKWVILLIIFVFDPLAIVLILAGNYLLEKRAREKGEVIVHPAAALDISQSPPEIRITPSAPAPVVEELPEIESAAIEPDAPWPHALPTTELKEDRPPAFTSFELPVTEEHEEPEPAIATDEALATLLEVPPPTVDAPAPIEEAAAASETPAPEELATVDEPAPEPPAPAEIMNHVNSHGADVTFTATTTEWRPAPQTGGQYASLGTKN
jgi:hypothetical protein